MAERIRIGIIGAGANTRRKHIPGFQEIDGVEIVVVCNRSKHSSTVVADEFGIPNVGEQWTDVVTDKGVDAVLIGTWPYLHHPATLASLHAGKHVLCEARMAMNSRQAREMLETAIARPDLTTQIVPSPFTLGVDRTVSRLITDGFLGEMRFVEVTALSDAHPSLDPELGWRHQRRFSGNNVLSLGIWYETLLRWVGAATEVSAVGTTFLKARRDPETGEARTADIPDQVAVIGRMACGADLDMRIGTAVGHGGPVTVTLYGSSGTLQYREGVLFGAGRGDETLSPVPIPDEERAGWRVEKEFIGAVRGTEPVRLTTFEDGVRYMEFTDAVTASMNSSDRIHLPLR